MLTSTADIALWISRDAARSAGLLADWEAVAAQPGAQGLFLRASYSDARGESREALQRFGDSVVTKVCGGINGFAWPSGASLEFEHFDTRDTFGGLTWSWIGIAECQQLDWADVLFMWTKLRSNLEVRPFGAPRFLLTGTEAPRGLNGPLIEALARAGTPETGYLGRSEGNQFTAKNIFAATREAAAEMAGVQPENVLSFDLVVSP
jgi:hypothetical protein